MKKPVVSIRYLFDGDMNTVMGTLNVFYTNTNDINNIEFDYSITDFTGQIIVND
jgi:hypothetical protein